MALDRSHLSMSMCAFDLVSSCTGVHECSPDPRVGSEGFKISRFGSGQMLITTWYEITRVMCGFDSTRPWPWYLVPGMHIHTSTTRVPCRIGCFEYLQYEYLQIGVRGASPKTRPFCTGATACTREPVGENYLRTTSQTLL